MFIPVLYGKFMDTSHGSIFYPFFGGGGGGYPYLEDSGIVPTFVYHSNTTNTCSVNPGETYISGVFLKEKQSQQNKK